MALHRGTSITENSHIIPGGRGQSWGRGGVDVLYTWFTFTPLSVCVWFVCPCVECCCATLIPVRALSQARGRSSSKTHKTLEVFPQLSDTDWRRAKESAGSTPARCYISIFFDSQEAAGFGCQHRTPSLPLAGCIHEYESRQIAACTRRKTRIFASAAICGWRHTVCSHLSWHTFGNKPRGPKKTTRIHAQTHITRSWIAGPFSHLCSVHALFGEGGETNDGVETQTAESTIRRGGWESYRRREYNSLCYDTKQQAGWRENIQNLGMRDGKMFKWKVNKAWQLG